MTGATDKKAKLEVVSYTAVTIMMFAGTILCLTAMLLPYWYKQSYTVGIVKIEVDLGLYQDRICAGDDQCDTKWLSDYDRDDVLDFPKFDIIRGLEMAGVINAGMGLFALISLWCSRGASQCRKNLAQALFFLHSLASAFLCVTGTLVLSSQASRGDIGIASILTGIGSAFLFVSACISCLVCRYDPTYGTMENPVSKSYRV